MSELHPTTPTEVKALLIEALQTLAALPDPERRFLRQKGTGWPEALREAGEVFAAAVHAGGYEAMEAPRIRPTPSAITRMWAVLPWLQWVRRDDVTLFVGQAAGWPWWRCGAPLRIGESAARMRAERAAETVLSQLQSPQAGSQPGARGSQRPGTPAARPRSAARCAG